MSFVCPGEMSHGVSRYPVSLLNRSGGMHLFLFTFAVQSAALSLQKLPAVPQKEKIMCVSVSSHRLIPAVIENKARISVCMPSVFFFF